MSRILKRPMFRKGGSPNKGIMTGLVDRKQYAKGSIDREEARANIDILADVIGDFTPKPKLNYGGFGIKIASGVPVLQALSEGYGEYRKADDARTAGIKGTATKLGLSKALEKSKKGFKILTKDELAKNYPQLDQTKAYKLNLDTREVSKIGGADTNINLGDAASAPLKIRKQFLAESKDFIKQNNSRNQVLSNTNVSFKNRKATDDFALIYSVYKYLDPTSVVRETEFQTLSDLGSVGERLKVIIPGWTKGTKLSEQKVADLAATVNRSFPELVEKQSERENIYENIFKKGGYDEYIQSYIPSEFTSSNKSNTKINVKSMSTEELIKKAGEMP